MLVADYLLANPDSELSGQAVKEILAQSHGRSLKGYIEEVVLKQGEDARDVILLIAPIVLRISLNIIILDYEKELFKVALFNTLGYFHTKLFCY